MSVELITLCLIVNKYLSSRDISFSKVIPWSLFQVNFIGDWAVNLVLPVIDHIESEFGILTFLSVVINPLLMDSDKLIKLFWPVLLTATLIIYMNTL